MSNIVIIMPSEVFAMMFDAKLQKELKGFSYGFGDTDLTWDEFCDKEVYGHVRDDAIGEPVEPPS